MESFMGKYRYYVLSKIIHYSFVFAFINITLIGCLPTPVDTLVTEDTGEIHSDEIHDIRVDKDNAIKTTIGTEEFELPNCGGTTELSQTLGTQASVQRGTALGGTVRTSAGLEVGLQIAAQVKLEAEVELTYQQEYSMANSRLDTITMAAAENSHVIYVIEWEEQEFSSIVSFTARSVEYLTPYKYTLSVPKIIDSYQVICPGSTLQITPSALTSPQVTQEKTVAPEQTPVVPTETLPDSITQLEGKIVFTCQLFRDENRNQICLIYADGTGYMRLTTEDDAIQWYASLSPDGNSIVYSSNETGTFEIYEMDLNGNKTKLTQEMGELYAPEISPDGNLIVFSNEQDKSMEIWVMNRDGSNPHTIFTPSSGIAVDPVWSPDGNQILFASGLNDNKSLYIINSDGSNLHQITNIEGIRGRSDWSHDGKTLATYIGSSWEREIYLLNYDGSNLRQFTNGGTNLAPSFSPDDQWIAFTSYRDNKEDNNGCEIYIKDLDSNKIIRLTDNSHCDWQPRWGP